MSFVDAQTVARRVAKLVSERIGAALWLRDYPVSVDGEIGRVVLGVERGTLHRAIAVVADLGSATSAVYETAVPALRGHQLGNRDKEAALAEAIATVIRARDSATGGPWPLGLLDAGYGILDAMTQRLGVAGSSWRLATWGEWDDLASGVSVELYGDHDWRDLISIRPGPGAVTIAIPAAIMAGTEHVRMLATPGALVDALGGIVDDVRSAVDGRAAFRGRAEGIQQFGQRLIDVLRSREALRGTVRLALREGSGFPRTWPSATVERVDDRGAHGYATLAETAAGVTVTVDTAFGPYPTFTAAAVDLDAITAEVRTAVDRLRPDHLEPGRIYRVIAPIRGVSMLVGPPARVRFVGVDYHPRDDVAIYRFAVVDPDAERALELAEHSDADLAILRRLHEVLAAVDPS